MTKKITLLVLLTVSLSLYSQEQRRVQISVHSGRFMAGSEEIYKNIQSGQNFGIDVRFFLTERFFLTAHLNHGRNDYFEDSYLTNAPNDGTWWIDGRGPFNATLKMNNVGLLAGYYLPVTQWLNMRGQIGISQLIEVSADFPVKMYHPHLGEDVLTHRDSVIFTAAFPVKFDIGFTPFKQLRNIESGFVQNIELGFTAGFYIAPDWAFFHGIYFGPQLSVSF
jgi:hypothetical protein